MIKEAGTETVKLLCTFWDQACIQMQKLQRARKLYDLHDNWKSLNKNKQTEKQQMNENDFHLSLDRLWHCTWRCDVNDYNCWGQGVSLSPEVGGEPWHNGNDMGYDFCTSRTTIKRWREERSAWTTLNLKIVNWKKSLNLHPTLHQIAAVPVIFIPLFRVMVQKMMWWLCCSAIFNRHTVNKAHQWLHENYEPTTFSSYG